MPRSVNLCDRRLPLAGLRTELPNGRSGVVQVISSVSAPTVAETPPGGPPDGLKLLRYVVHVGKATKGVAVADLDITGGMAGTATLNPCRTGSASNPSFAVSSASTGPDGAMGAVSFTSSLAWSPAPPPHWPSRCRCG